MVADYEIILRLLVAAGLGALVGFERELQNQPAGLRTHIVVVMGASLAMSLSIHLAMQFREFAPNGDPARLAAQVISGIGFLGAGAILRFGASVKGLTTAASLWTMAIVGLVVAAAGFGVFLASFYRSTRQAGPLVAIALTVTGMAGGLMTTGVPSLSSAFETVQLWTPQGWALRLWNLALDGATGPGLWLAFGGVLVYGGVLFAVGALVFRRRFA